MTDHAWYDSAVVSIRWLTLGLTAVAACESGPSSAPDYPPAPETVAFRARLEAAWTATATLAMSAQARSVRMSALERFIDRYPDHNPYRLSALEALDRLRADESPVATNLKMVRVPGGEFDDLNYHRDGVRRRVFMHPFRIDRTEVTVAEFKRCVEAGQCSRATITGHGADKSCNWGRPDHEHHPMNCVSWSGAAGYCRAKGKRLPAELEWDKAGWGPAGPPAPQPRSDDQALGIHSAMGSHPVGSQPSGSSPYGVLDMFGNVSEWMWATLNARIHVARGPSGNSRPASHGTLRTPHAAAPMIERRRFAASDALLSPDRAPTIGFRCALSEWESELLVASLRAAPPKSDASALRVRHPDWVMRGDGVFDGGKKVVDMVGAVAATETSSPAQAADEMAQAKLRDWVHGWLDAVLRHYAQTRDASAPADGLRSIGSRLRAGITEKTYVKDSWTHPLDGTVYALARFESEEFERRLRALKLPLNVSAQLEASADAVFVLPP